MKRILTLFFLLATLGFTKSHAQFDAGTGYIAAGLSNLNFNYTDKGGIRAGMNIDGGYFVADCLLARASFGYNHYAKHNDAFTLGAGLRYYVIQNGLSIGTGAEFFAPRPPTSTTSTFPSSSATRSISTTMSPSSPRCSTKSRSTTSPAAAK